MAYLRCSCFPARAGSARPGRRPADRRSAGSFPRAPRAQVRLLSNLETDSQKLLPADRPHRAARAQGDARRLAVAASRQRITVRYHLDSLSRGETELYIYYRMQVAGGSSRPTFSSWALSRITATPKGSRA
ncbi:MAG: hypothetical protein R2862_02220 [Thermoanaerobaculia bacterium]